MNTQTIISLILVSIVYAKWIIIIMLLPIQYMYTIYVRNNTSRITLLLSIPYRLLNN